MIPLLSRLTKIPAPSSIARTIQNFKRIIYLKCLLIAIAYVYIYIFFHLKREKGKKCCLKTNKQTTQ